MRGGGEHGDVMVTTVMGDGAENESGGVWDGERKTSNCNIVM